MTFQVIWKERKENNYDNLSYDVTDCHMTTCHNQIVSNSSFPKY